MIRSITTSLFTFLFIGALAADKKYPVSTIPVHLQKNAHAVKRMEQIEFRIVDVDQTILITKYAITVLNENGEHYARLVEFYDKFRQVKSIEGKLYDASGDLLKTLKSKEVLDISAVDDISLIDDNRRKVHQFYYKTYPYTVEYEVEKRINNTMFIPGWVPLEGEYLAVEQSSYTVICPSDYEVRYRAFNYSKEPVVTQEKNNKFMKWEIRNLSAIKVPFASPVWREMAPVVYFAPTRFEVQGYKGNMSTWKDLGMFQYALNQKRDALPESMVQKVKELTAGINDNAEKVRVLYSYLQKNTRYISIQLGLGGWQPFEASFVAQKGYGDCKALTNYMYSLLKVAGIRSNPVLIFAGDNDEENLIADFPSLQFNHVVLCVPMAKDTMWLECTSQSNPAGYMGDFTGNRKALLVDETGGSIVSTPRYTKTENLQDRVINAKLENDGTLAMKVKTTYGGIQQDNLSMMINQLSKEKIHKILQEALELSTYHVNDFRYEETKAILPVLKENLDITVNAYATISGKRIFITPNILNRNGKRIEEDTARKVDFVFNYEYRDVDNYEIFIPDGYEVEALPQETSIKSKFGIYHSAVALEGNKIVYKREMERFGGRFPAKDQSELIKFYADIYKADRSKMVLVKK